MKKKLRFPPNVIVSFLWALVLGIPVAVVTVLVSAIRWGQVRELTAVPFLCGMTGPFLIWPFLLTAAEVYFLLKPRKDAWQYDAVTVPLGVLYTILLLGVLQGVEFLAPVTEQIYEINTYPPIDPGRYPTVILFCLCAAAGWGVLTFCPKNKLPPLACVLSLSGLYLGCGMAVLFGIQTLRGGGNGLILLLPLNGVLITARLVRQTAEDARTRLRPEGLEGRPLLGPLYRLFLRWESWPILAALGAVPLFGAITALLILFGQSPDSAIRAFTETAEWNLSRIPTPEKLPYDMHYLCTVAARGHRKLVRPLRLGLRHGHAVTANRQLLVANAFEDLLEKKTPGLHRRVRRFYDTHGLPVARHIRNPYASDAVYLLMKPAEWFFLFCLYLFDPDPESRIARQYTGMQ